MRLVQYSHSLTTRFDNGVVGVRVKLTRQTVLKLHTLWFDGVYSRLRYITLLRGRRAWVGGAPFWPGRKVSVQAKEAQHAGSVRLE